MEEKKKVTEFVRGLVAAKGIVRDFSDEEVLVTGGLLDSMDVLTIVLFLEENYALDFAVIDFDPEKFDTIDGIYSMVTNRAG